MYQNLNGKNSVSIGFLLFFNVATILISSCNEENPPEFDILGSQWSSVTFAILIICVSLMYVELLSLSLSLSLYASAMTQSQWHLYYTGKTPKLESHHFEQSTSGNEVKKITWRCLILSSLAAILSGLIVHAIIEAIRSSSSSDYTPGMVGDAVHSIILCVLDSQMRTAQ